MTQPTPYRRAISLSHYANRSKVNNIADFITTTWRAALTIQKQNLIAFMHTGEQPRLLNKSEWFLPFDRPTMLTARQWKSVDKQVLETFSSWLTAHQSEDQKLVSEMRRNTSVFTEDFIHDLYFINKWKAWWCTDTKNQYKGALVGKESALKYWRTVLMPILMQRHRYPNFSHTHTALVDMNTIAPLRDKTENARHSASHFDQWCELTISPGEKIMIPFMDNSYSTQKLHDASQVNNRMQLTVEQNPITGERDVAVKRIATYSPFSHEQPQLQGVKAFDWGLSNLLTSSDGELFGQRFYEGLLLFDAEIRDMEKKLTEGGLRKWRASKRYRTLVSAVKEFITNEVGRIVNRIGRDNLHTIIVEDLDFRGKGFSREFSRIITKSGRSILKKRLAELSERTGTVIETVNPAYTSQECSSCHFVCAGNRRGKKFHCHHCGLRLNADVNASRVILSRSSRKLAMLSESKNKVYEALDGSFFEKNGYHFSDVLVQRELSSSS